MIDLIVLDVDGCMTNGKIIYSNSGDEIKSFNIKDGFAIKQWMRFGKKVAIITGRDSMIVEKRAKELGIHYLFQGMNNKVEALEEIKLSSNIDYEKIAAIGDDLNDYRLLKKVGISFCPNDAIEYIRKNVDVVLSRNGGEGAVREMIEYLLKKEGKLDEYYNYWTKGIA
ncbi:KdsC family phosphatase [Nitrosophilus kaiyonis]|uniref:KdsC family phosphatase n=1 Tax=Nitrosophilus kaiyonis TaxID=2930200 RepID=UPI0024921428|nr:HAD-IIIA family hydrolase [Nitrosophilus kaiyonis]